VYKTVPHITLKSIANNKPAATEMLVVQPLKDNKIVRSGENHRQNEWRKTHY
jgi:adenine-specific DNA-methyltransferase